MCNDAVIEKVALAIWATYNGDESDRWSTASLDEKEDAVEMAIEALAALEAGDSPSSGLMVLRGPEGVHITSDFGIATAKQAAEAMREACAAHAAVLIQGFCSADTCTSVYNAICKLKLPE